MQTNRNAVVVLQHDEHSSVNNSRPAGEEVTGTRKKGVSEEKEKGSGGAVQEEPLIIFHGPTRDRTFNVMVIQIG